MEPGGIGKHLFEGSPGVIEVRFHRQQGGTAEAHFGRKCGGVGRLRGLRGALQSGFGFGEPAQSVESLTAQQAGASALFGPFRAARKRAVLIELGEGLKCEPAAQQGFDIQQSKAPLILTGA